MITAAAFTTITLAIMSFKAIIHQDEDHQLQHLH